MDRRISSLINKHSKTGEIGFFNMVDTNLLYFEITPILLDKINNEAKNLQLKN